MDQAHTLSPGPINNQTGLLVKPRRYFPAVDGLRFVAALMVIVHHLPPATTFPANAAGRGLLLWLSTFGWIGVDIFLVLSSYLIFSLLLEEKRLTGSVSLKSFYMRRVLRIWPLYYPYILLAFFVLPRFTNPGLNMAQTISEHLLPMLTFTGNLSYLLFTGSLIGTFAHLWTISLEEQFYIVAPVLGVFARKLRHDAWKIALATLAFTFAARWYVLTNEIRYPVVWVFTLCRLDPFVIGAACAALLHLRPDLARWPVGWAFTSAGILGLWYATRFPQIGTSSHTVWQLSVVAFSAGALLLGALTKSGTKRLLSLPGLPFLGKISFGIYVYHYLVAILVPLNLPLIMPVGWGPRTIWWAQSGTVLLITVGLASASYLLWERPFLRLKTRFERIATRPA